MAVHLLCLQICDARLCSSVHKVHAYTRNMQCLLAISAFNHVYSFSEPNLHHLARLRKKKIMPRPRPNLTLEVLVAPHAVD
jgi:hypothetical protein